MSLFLVFDVLSLFVNVVKINQFLQTGHHDSGGTDNHSKHGERTNDDASHTVHVFDGNIVALALDSTE
jgi:hypothetical protein